MGAGAQAKEQNAGSIGELRVRFDREKESSNLARKPGFLLKRGL